MNEVRLSGNLTRNPDIYLTKTGKKVANFTLASGTGINTLFIRCSAWGELADEVETLLKGNGVDVKGFLSENKWKDKNGEDRKEIRIVVQEIVKMGPHYGRAQERECVSHTPPYEDDVPF